MVEQNVIPVPLQKELVGQVEAEHVVEIRLVDHQWRITKRPEAKETFELDHAIQITNTVPATLSINAQLPGDFPCELLSLPNVPPGTYLLGLLLSHRGEV